MALKIFEFVEQLMMDTFMLKLTQFEKSGSLDKTFNSMGNLIINFPFRNNNNCSSCESQRSYQCRP